MICLFISSCQKTPLTNGDVITKTRVLSGFNSIHLYNNIDVTLIESDCSKIEITTGENLMNKITNVISDSTLHLKNENTLNWIRSYDYPLEAKIYFDGKLSSITYESVGNLTSLGYIHQDSSSDFELNLHEAAGKIDLDIVCRNLYIKSYDFDCTSDITIKGMSDYAMVYQTGLGPIHMEDFTSRQTYAYSYNYNDIYIHSTDFLHADIHSSGSIYYKGHPEISLNISPNALGKLIPYLY